MARLANRDWAGLYADWRRAADRLCPAVLEPLVFEPVPYKVDRERGHLVREDAVDWWLRAQVEHRREHLARGVDPEMSFGRRGGALRVTVRELFRTRHDPELVAATWFVALAFENHRERTWSPGGASCRDSGELALARLGMTEVQYHHAQRGPIPIDLRIFIAADDLDYPDVAVGALALSLSAAQLVHIVDADEYAQRDQLSMFPRPRR